MVTYWSLLHFSWETGLYCFQTYVNIIRNQTTNEYWNQKKYDYLWINSGQKRIFRNPFNLGIWQNFLSFWTPYGKHSNLDYTQLYSLADLKKKN